MQHSEGSGSTGAEKGTDSVSFYIGSPNNVDPAGKRLVAAHLERMLRDHLGEGIFVYPDPGGYEISLPPGSSIKFRDVAAILPYQTFPGCRKGKPYRIRKRGYTTVAKQLELFELAT